MGKLTKKETRIISLALASWGVIMLGSGFTMKSMIKPTEVKKNDLEVVHKRVAEIKTNEIKLKDMELEINQSLSVDVKDYLENLADIDQEVLKSLKLDTSMVKVNEAGSYTYTISYKKKKYNGTFIIKEKELPNVDLTINNLRLTIGSPLSTDKQVYIKETLTDEIKNNILIDLTAVDTQKVGNYKYTVTYNGILYTGTIEVYEPQQKVLTPSNGTEDKEKPDNKEENKEDTKTETAN
ncbi:unknown [Mycoplasma sp. CAG:877]|nr:unknown [Mycoplasma sp. CAG:877]